MRLQLTMAALVSLISCAVDSDERGTSVQGRVKWRLKFSDPKSSASDKADRFVTVHFISEDKPNEILLSHKHFAGEDIGWWRESDTGPSVSVHRAFNGKVYDFDTRAVLENVEFLSGGIVGQNEVFEAYYYFIRYVDTGERIIRTSKSLIR